ncbi:hypothetical protein TIFTF001_011670 [Ficus carica]|uniref:Polygalacturonase n=1 Tax=Ficus carica TaxID=3494 RepID=A0AA88D4F6_FICCA|nr:hypothetical protein TIFTF001_011670 [Ficus carica]
MVSILCVNSSTKFCDAATTTTTTYNVVSFGAKPNGVKDSTQAFLNAWAAACASVGPTRIFVTKGRYLLRPLSFNGPCKSPHITFRIDGTLVAPLDYRVLGAADNWIDFQGVSGLDIVGGSLDARGPALWACKATAANNCPNGATTLSITYSNNIKVIGLLSLNSQMFHIVVNHCQNVEMRGVKVMADGESPNTDGIHVQQSRNIAIFNSTVRTGDDCVSIGPGTQNLWIERMSCGPGHGISIGSLAKDLDEEGVKNVTVKKAVFTGTQNGLRIKSWAKPSKGFVQGVQFLNILMQNVQNPIIIDQNYCPHNINCPDQVSGVQISDVVYRDIKGTSATAVAMKFECSARNPCKGIRLEDVNLTYNNQAAQSSCSNANGNSFGKVLPDSCLLNTTTTTTYNVVSFGAKPNGVKDSTQAFLNAWAAACASVVPTRIFVPKGRYLLLPLSFNGPCKSPHITFRIDGTLVAPLDYQVLGAADNWIDFQGVSGLDIVGGSLDARGPALWACKGTATNNCPNGATTLSITYSSNIKVIGLLSLNSQMFHIVVNHCQNVEMRGVKVMADGQSPNTDGIHVQQSRNVAIFNSTVRTGDDCVSIGPGTQILWIERMPCGPGHGISIGSLGKDLVEEGVKNVTVKKAVFTGTQNGLRIKSWAKPSKGFVQGVQFLNVLMQNVQNPIIIDQNYCPHNINCPDPVSGVQISDVVYREIKGTSATAVAMKFECSARNPCKGIRLEDVNLTYNNQAAQSSCSNADGKSFGKVLPDSCL